MSQLSEHELMELIRRFVLALEDLRDAVRRVNENFDALNETMRQLKQVTVAESATYRFLQGVVGLFGRNAGR